MPKFCVKIDIDLCVLREGSTFSSMTLIYFLRLVQVIDITNFGVLIMKTFFLFTHCLFLAQYPSIFAAKLWKDLIT